VLKSLGMTAWPLPAVPGALPRLADLQASHNPISAVPALALQACPNLRNLELAGVGAAGRLPPGALLGAPHLETLDLAQTGCAEVPADVLGLGSLRVLVLSGNRLAALPVELTGLRRCGLRPGPPGAAQPLGLHCAALHILLAQAALPADARAAAAGWRSCTWRTTASAACRRSWA
jgi:hypothetical protein